MINVSQNLAQKQLQLLKPQQILLSKLLQLPLLHLEQKIQAELETNPGLEEVEEMEEIRDDFDDEIDADAEEAEQIREEFDTLEENNKSDENKLNEEIQDEINVEDLLPNNDEDIPEPKMPVDRSREQFDMPERYHETLAERLIEQLHMLNVDEAAFNIGEYIIHNLQDDGYLDSAVTVRSIAATFGAEPALVECILKLIQRFEPVGIAARDLQECLLVQLEVKNKDGRYDLPIRVLRDAYQDFVNRRFEKVAHELAVSLNEIKCALATIEKLNPKPGHGDADARLQYIVPDFYVKKVDGELNVSLTESRLPRLRISKAYRKMLQKPKGLDKEVKKYLQNKLVSATWFIEAIQKREQTMQKTIHALVDRQYEFFDKGPAHIKPMIMKDIARMINRNISTVSRVCNGKYVETDHGIFELRSFFSPAMEMEDGETLSNLKVKSLLRQIIDSENKKKPHSDEKLTKLLNAEKIHIARRTVAKYREQMDIPVARLRREI